jgi:hypothetical protein
MEQSITSIIEHMAVSHRELAKILDHKGRVGVRMSTLIDEVPSVAPSFEDVETLMEHALGITKSVTYYLNSLADLEDAISANVTLVINELTPSDGDE